MQHGDANSIPYINPNIEYPCMWSYRIIGIQKEAVLEAIEHVLGDGAVISPTHNFSSHNKYVAINCQIRVHSDEERIGYFDGLVNQSGIIMVI